MGLSHRQDRNAMSADKNPTTRINTKFQNGHSAGFGGIELFYRGEKYDITVGSLPFLIGREQGACQLVVQNGLVSRIHCAIELRDGQIGLLDRSTNGTSIKVGRGGSVMINNKFYPLAGRGSIQLGAEIKLDDPDLILFKTLGPEPG